MAVQGELKKTDQGFDGYIASEAFDHEIKIRKNAEPRSEDAPDWHVFAPSPRGRDIKIGGVWHRISRRDNEYLSMSVTIDGRNVNANIFPANDRPGILVLREWRL